MVNGIRFHSRILQKNSDNKKKEIRTIETHITIVCEGDSATNVSPIPSVI